MYLHIFVMVMDIEREIQQAKFKDEFQKALINLFYTSNVLGSKVYTALKPFDITPEQFNVLRILRGQYPNPATVNLIVERMMNKNSNASRLVEKLRIKKLIERAVCPEDRRAVNVIITKEGLKLLEKLDKKEEQWVNDLKKLTKEEAKQLNFLLNKIRE